MLSSSLALASLPLTWAHAAAQVREEADNEPVTLTRKGIDKQLDVISVDLLEAEAKAKLSECVYVFIAHGAGDQWTLRENRRAMGDFAFAPQRMGALSGTESTRQ